MKTLTCIAAILCSLFVLQSYAQAPNTFKFQSMVRKSDGTPLVNQLVRVRISLIKSSVTGQAVYSEIHLGPSNNFGIVNLNIGEGLDKVGSIANIDWSADAYFVKVEIDETGGTNYTLSTVSQLLSVPYALYATTSSYANNAGAIDWSKVGNKPSLFSGNYNDLSNKPVVFSGNYNDLAGKPALFSGNYNDLTGKPSLFSGSFNDLTNKPTLFSGNYNDLSGKPSLFSGSYNDLTDKPTVVSKSQYDNEMSAIWAELNEILIDKGLYRDVRDGQTYNCVQIGNQTWMAENLNFYSKTGSYYYNNDSLTYASTYGRLYDWETSKKVCPSGWHLPTNPEWETLFAFLGGNGVAGGKMKTTGTTLWQSPNNDATNSSGFSALPGGFRNTSGVFSQVKETAYFWSNYITNNSATNLFINHMYGAVSYVGNSGGLNPANSLSVRCIRN